MIQVNRNHPEIIANVGENKFTFCNGTASPTHLMLFDTTRDKITGARVITNKGQETDFTLGQKHARRIYDNAKNNNYPHITGAAMAFSIS